MGRGSIEAPSSKLRGMRSRFISRGNEKRDIFLSNRDRSMFLAVPGEMAHRFQIEIFPYVLIANHYHLLLGT